MKKEFSNAIYSIGTDSYIKKEAKEMSENQTKNLKKNGVFGNEPIDFDIIPEEINRNKVLKMILFPDLNEIVILIASLLITFLVLAPALRFDTSSPSFIIFFGFVSFSLYGYRWGYAGVAHFAARQKRIMEEIADGKKIVLDLKLFGLILSPIIIFLGYQLR